MCITEVFTLTQSKQQQLYMRITEVFTPVCLFQRESMHPAVIFVITVIGVFSAALTAGMVLFIVIFYRQMEYEGYKQGGIISKLMNADFGMTC